MQVRVQDTQVTAQRQLQDQKAVPMAITVLDRRELHHAQVRRLADLDAHVPFLNATFFNSASPQLYIRGIGSTLNSTGDDPSVAMFLDGLYINRPAFQNMELMDLQRVEILRGPQSALWGKNVIGGAVQLMPVEPEDNNSLTMETRGNTEYGRGASLIGNETLRDGALRHRLSGSYQQTNRNAVNPNTSSALDDGERYQLRDQWAGEYQQLRWRSLLELHRTRDGEGPALQAFGSAGPPLPGNLLPTHQAADDAWLPTDGFVRADDQLFSLHLEHPLGDWTLSNLLGLQHGHADYMQALFPSRVDTWLTGAEERNRQFSEEIRLHRDSTQHQWDVGIYLSREDIEREKVYNARGYYSLLRMPLSTNRPGYAFYNGSAQVDTASLFGQWRTRLGPSDHLSLGVRGDWIRKNTHLDATGGDPLDLLLKDSEDFSSHANHIWQEPTWRLAWEHQLAPQRLLYVTYSSGYKAGSYNNDATNAEEATYANDPEHAESVELGLKGDWFEQRLRTNAALFHTRYDNLQIYSSSGYGGATAASSNIEGLELELTVVPVEGWQAGLSYAWLNARYNTYSDSQSNIDYSGNQLTRAPRHAATTHLQYTLPLENLGGHLSARWQGSYRGDFFTSASNATASHVDDMWLQDAGVAWESQSGALQVSLFLKNISDEDVVLSQLDISRSVFGEAGIRSLDTGRHVELTLDWQFK